MPGVTVELGDPRGAEERALVDRFWDELASRYGDAAPPRFSPEEVEGEGCAFVVARLEGRAVGCGAIRPLEGGAAELKRMYVEPSARRAGVGRLILGELERRAAAAGYASVRLLTGVWQPEAIRLYEREGYERVRCRGADADDPLRVCFEKMLRGRGE